MGKQNLSVQVITLRVVHGLAAGYFLLCLVYMYYAALVERYDALLVVAIISLGLEGFIVFVLNKGDCPLIHVQRKIGDDTPFFALLMPAALAKRAIPIFAISTWIALGAVIIRYIA